jgi:hypothetical protein
MRYRVTILVLPLMAVSTPAMAGDPFDWSGQMELATHYVDWKLTKDPVEGYQVWTPLSFSATGRNSDYSVTISGRSGLIHSQQQSHYESPTYNETTLGSVSDFTDTALQTQIQFLGGEKVVPYLTFGVNLPTGHSTVRYSFDDLVNHDGRVNNEINAASLMPAISYLTEFGEGFNALAGGGASIALSEQLTVGFGGTYSARGEYVALQETEDLYHETIRPGDQISLSGSLQYALSPETSIRLGLDYKTEATKLNTQSTGYKTYYKQGDSYTTSLQLSHEWNERHASSLHFSNSNTLAQRTKGVFSTGVVGYETEAANFDRYQWVLSHDWQATDTLAFTPKLTLNYLTGTSRYMEGFAGKDLSTFLVQGEVDAAYRLSESMLLGVGAGAYILETQPSGGSDYVGVKAHGSIKWEW